MLLDVLFFAAVLAVAAAFFQLGRTYRLRLELTIIQAPFKLDQLIEAEAALYPRYPACTGNTCGISNPERADVSVDPKDPACYYDAQVSDR